MGTNIGVYDKMSPRTQYPTRTSMTRATTSVENEIAKVVTPTKDGKGTDPTALDNTTGPGKRDVEFGSDQSPKRCYKTGNSSVVAYMVYMATMV